MYIYIYLSFSSCQITLPESPYDMPSFPLVPRTPPTTPVRPKPIVVPDSPKESIPKSLLVKQTDEKSPCNDEKKELDDLERTGVWHETKEGILYIYIIIYNIFIFTYIQLFDYTYTCAIYVYNHVAVLFRLKLYTYIKYIPVFGKPEHAYIYIYIYKMYIYIYI